MGNLARYIEKKRTTLPGAFYPALFKTGKEGKKSGGNNRWAVAATLLFFSVLMIWCGLVAIEAGVPGAVRDKAAGSLFQTKAAPSAGQRAVALHVCVQLRDEETETQISGFYEGWMTAGKEKTVFNVAIGPDKTGPQRAYITFSALDDNTEENFHLLLCAYADTTLLFSAQVRPSRPASFSFSGEETARLRITCRLIPG